jgi:hypothetical protein
LNLLVERGDSNHQKISFPWNYRLKQHKKTEGFSFHPFLFEAQKM